MPLDDYVRLLKKLDIETAMVEIPTLIRLLCTTSTAVVSLLVKLGPPFKNSATTRLSHQLLSLKRTLLIVYLLFSTYFDLYSAE